MFYIPLIVLPLAIKLFLIVFCFLIFRSVLDFARLTRRHFRHHGNFPEAERIVKGTAAPDLIAAFATSSRVLGAIGLDKFLLDHKPDAEADEQTTTMLRRADARFAYLWERCNADLESAKTTARLILPLSIAMVGFGGFGTVNYLCDRDGASAFQCVVQTVDQLLLLLALGAMLCSLIYGITSLFARALQKRKASWRYFVSRLTLRIIEQSE